MTAVFLRFVMKTTDQAYLRQGSKRLFPLLSLFLKERSKGNHLLSQRRYFRQHNVRTQHVMASKLFSFFLTWYVLERETTPAALYRQQLLNKSNLKKKVSEALNG
jgi:hypothetical protein